MIKQTGMCALGPVLLVLYFYIHNNVLNVSVFGLHVVGAGLYYGA